MIVSALLCILAQAPYLPNPKDDGYRGIWFTLGQQGDYGDKYSGGLGTYTAKHRPLAVYSAEARKTFFVYGGGRQGERYLLIMASHFDHDSGAVPRPTIVYDKGGVNDPHDNPSIALDGGGHVWVFVSGRGRNRPGVMLRSREPLNVDAFEEIWSGEMTYPQPHWLPESGFMLMHTKYTDGRELYWRCSADGRTWTEDRKLAGMGGHYEVSASQGERVAAAFNMHPGGNVDRRTNLYYVETRDCGRTWQTVDGQSLEVPLTNPVTPALVRDFAAEGRLVYVKDLNFDAVGRPIVLVVTSSDHMPGPAGDPRLWTVAHWTGAGWRFHEVTSSTHNYDMGSLYVEGTVWRILAPTDAGPQPLGAGGEVVLWESPNAGQNWRRVRNLTHSSPLNHGYVRRPLNAHPDFYAFWADGNPDRHSASRLYFTNHDGTKVWRLPYDMAGTHATPEIVFNTL